VLVSKTLAGYLKGGAALKLAYKYSDEDGFDYKCYMLRFLEGSLVEFNSLD